MIVFALTVFFLIVTPGPGVLSLAGVGSAFGRGPGLRYLLGLFVGHNAVALATILGLTALILVDPRVRAFMFALSMLYLLYLAAKIARSDGQISIRKAQAAPGFLGGLALQFVNPKAYMVNATFFSGFPFFPSSLVTEILLKVIIFNAIWIPVHLLWLWMGLTLRRLDLRPQVMRRINMILAGLLLCVIAVGAWSYLSDFSTDSAATKSESSS